MKVFGNKMKNKYPKNGKCHTARKFLNIYIRWLRYYATSREVSALIPDEIIGFFQFT
jgi:hypothetical protein